MIEKGFYLRDNKYYYCSTTNTLINAEFKDTYLKYHQERKIEIKDVEIDTASIKSSLTGLKQIIFEVTQKCSLRCSYCVYESGEYHFNRASGSSKSLELKTAKKAIHQVWQLIKERDKKELTIGFYGGEPLLEFKNIKKIINYSRQIFIGWKLSFTITTNGTLLNDTITRYLIENNFSTFVSLDGPEKNHDAKRVFHDGRGSYRIVVENLKRIRAIDSNYYNNNVTISAVYSKDLPFEETFRYFNEHELVRDISLSFGFVNETGSTYYVNNPYDPGKYSTARKKIFESVKRKKKEGKELSAMEFNMLQNHELLLKGLGNRSYTSLMGACFFDSRLYVDADGGFHICEKMNNKFQIGDAEKGFDYPKMVSTADNYINLLKKNCFHCEVNYLCMKCYIYFSKNGNFEINDDFCTKKKLSTRKMLEELIEIEEGKLAKGAAK